LLAGIKDTLLIDDSYNASPAAVESALATLVKMETTGRKIAVLGDMLELGPLTIEAHRQIGAMAASAVDYLITVGLRTQFLAEAATKKKLPKKSQKHFDTYHGVGEYLQNLIAPGDVILIKGSQSIRLEKVVEEIMAHPEDKEKLLVRQEPEWQKR
jgi:UDP-N-acetylmuramoyl-tripeptide--D-alanyl-D-alanine ligase